MDALSKANYGLPPSPPAFPPPFPPPLSPPPFPPLSPLAPLSPLPCPPPSQGVSWSKDDFLEGWGFALQQTLN